MSGLAAGEIDVIVRDYDGTHRESFTEAWVLEREMAIDVNQLRDTTGEGSANIVEGAVLMGGDSINLTASVATDQCHAVFRRPSPPLGRFAAGRAVRGGDRPRGRDVVHIHPHTRSIRPDQDMTLMLWDPLETELLSVYDMPVFQLPLTHPNSCPRPSPTPSQGTTSRKKSVSTSLKVKHGRAT